MSIKERLICGWLLGGIIIAISGIIKLVKYLIS